MAEWELLVIGNAPHSALAGLVSLRTLLFPSGAKSGAAANSLKETFELYLSTLSKTKGTDALPDRRPGTAKYRYKSELESDSEMGWDSGSRLA